VGTPPIATPSSWARLLLAFAAVFAMFQLLAGALGSMRGEAGLLVGAAVVVAVLAADRWLVRTARSPASPLRLPARRGSWPRLRSRWSCSP